MLHLLDYLQERIVFEWEDLDRDTHLYYYLYRWIVDNLLHSMDWEMKSERKLVVLWTEIRRRQNMFTLPYDCVEPAVKWDVIEANADWPDGIKLDRVRSNDEPLCAVARTKTWTITVFESKESEEFKLELSAKKRRFFIEETIRGIKFKLLTRNTTDCSEIGYCCSWKSVGIIS